MPGDSAPLTDVEKPLTSGHEFDLTSDAGFERKDVRSNIAPMVVIYAVAGGGFALLGGLVLLGVIVGTPLEGWATLVVGLAVVVGGSYVTSQLGTDEVVSLRVDDRGLTFARAKGKVTTVQWSDPTLKLDLLRLDKISDKVLPNATDARRRRPSWVNLWNPAGTTIRLETTVPLPCLDAISAVAERNRLKVSRVSVTFFWWSGGPKSPGELHFREGTGLEPGDQPNGEVWKIRGTGA